MTLFDEQMTELLALRASVKSLCEKLEASHAREAQLREAIAAHEKECKTSSGWTMYYDATLHRVLALPTDDTALKARLRAERDRCAKYCDGTFELGGDALNCAAGIRNLGDQA